MILCAIASYLCAGKIKTSVLLARMQCQSVKQRRWIPIFIGVTVEVEARFTLLASSPACDDCCLSLQTKIFNLNRQASVETMEAPSATPYRQTEKRITTHSTLPRLSHETTSHRPSASSALKRPIKLTSARARGARNIFQTEFTNRPLRALITRQPFFDLHATTKDRGRCLLQQS